MNQNSPRTETLQCSLVYRKFQHFDGLHLWLISHNSFAFAEMSRSVCTKDLLLRT